MAGPYSADETGRGSVHNESGDMIAYHAKPEFWTNKMWHLHFFADKDDRFWVGGAIAACKDSASAIEIAREANIRFNEHVEFELLKKTEARNA